MTKQFLLWRVRWSLNGVFSRHTHPWLLMCGASGYEGCPRWCSILMEQSNWKVGCKEQDLKKRLDFHFLLCSMIESLVNVNTNRIFLAGVEKFWYEFCIHTLCWKFILQRSKDWMTETEIIASIQGRAQQDSRWLCGLHLFYFLAGDF